MPGDPELRFAALLVLPCALVAADSYAPGFGEEEEGEVAYTRTQNKQQAV
jgi:hypothetical protein